MEIWKTIPRHPNYEASTAGFVRSKLTKKILVSQKPNGYHVVRPYNDGVRKPRLVHQLILEAHVGPRPDGYQGLHGDDDKDNNALSNLRWGTCFDNKRDAVANGRIARGTSINHAVLDEEKVRAIRVCLSAGESERFVASKFGVTRGAIQSIKNRKSWAWLV